MDVGNSKRTLLCSVTLIGLSAPPAIAQDALDDPSTIIVTARRTEERLQDVPISITVLSQEQITSRNILAAGDLGTYTPSLSTNGRFGSESTSFAIRGFTQEGATTPSVAVYFADVTAPRANGGTTAGNGAGVGNYFDLQNVQVLKGPQGTLFGRNTTGGAVLLVPQRPTSNLEGYVEGSLGNYDMRRLQGVINVPLSEGLRVRLGGDYQTRDGYLRNRSGIGPGNFGDVDYWAIRASVIADLSPDVENYFIATYSNSSTNGFYPKIAVCNRALTSFTATQGCAQLDRQNNLGYGYYDVESGSPDAHQHIRQLQLINTTTWQASDTLTVKNIFSYSQFRQFQAANIFGDNFIDAATNLPKYYVGVVPVPGKDNTSQQSFTEELQFQGRSADGSFTWQAGGYVEVSNPLGGFQGTNAPIQIICADVDALQCRSGGAFIQQSLTKYWYRTYAGYAQATYQLNEQLSVTGGIRYTSDKSRGVGRVRNISFPVTNTPTYTCSVFAGRPAADPSVCDFRRAENSKKPTWLIGVDYKPNDDTLLYAKYTRGYRQGAINVSSVGFETWKPEKVDTYEIGAKLSFAEAVSGNFNISAFYNDFSNQQLQVNATPINPRATAPSAGIANAGKSTIQGIEIDASVRPFTGFSLDLSYAYLDTKLKSFTTPAYDPALFFPPTANAVIGGSLVLTPKNKYTITAAYSLPLNESVGRVTFAATFTHSDKSLGHATSVLRTLPSSDLLNLNLSWNAIAGMPVDLAVFATNITKEKFPVYIVGSYGTAGFDSYVLNQPRMYGLRVKYRFGS